MKYYFKPIDQKNALIKKPSYDRTYDTDPFNNVKNTKVRGRYY